MGCLPRPKLFRKRKNKDKKKDKPNIVSRFFISLYYIVSSCVADNNKTKESVDPETRKKISQRIFKRNQILYTAEYDDVDGAGPSGINEADTDGSDGPTVCSESNTSDSDVAGKGKNKKKPVALVEPCEDSKSKKKPCNEKTSAEKSKSSLFMEMFGEFGKSKRSFFFFYVNTNHFYSFQMYYFLFILSSLISCYSVLKLLNFIKFCIRSILSKHLLLSVRD